MAIATRYWRVLFRSRVNPKRELNIGFESMKLFAADGTEIIAASVTTNATSQDISQYPLESLNDNLEGTYWVAYFPYGTVNSLRYIDFDLGEGNEHLVDHVLIQTGAGPWSSRVALNGVDFDFIIDNSDDGITYYRQSLHTNPVRTNGTPYRIAATPISLIYPFPPKDQIGGSGGIYGIVSEDGVALPNRPVLLYDRETFSKVAWITTDENGGYGFNGLNVNNEFMVMSYDPSGPPFKNALVWDRIKPINSLGNITPQSAFWARRAREKSLGGIVSAAEYLDGTTYNFASTNIIGSQEQAVIGDGLGLLPVSAVGGSLKFLKSGRTPENTACGFSAVAMQGVFGGVNAASQPENYSHLTFEYLFVAPTSSEESNLFFVSTGTLDSNDGNMFNLTANPAVKIYTVGSGPTLEVKRDGIVNVRFPLGSRNRSIIRCSGVVTPGTINHIIVTYSMDEKITLYINGAFSSESLIPGSGRLWGSISGENYYGFWAIDNFDAYHSKSGAEGAIRRLVGFTVAGNGNMIENSNSISDRSIGAAGPGYGGAFALFAVYNRVFSASDVSDFYDSFVNWETHVVVSSLPGYMGEVEADNPNFYARLNDLSIPTRIESEVGPRSHYGTYSANAELGVQGFIGGATAVNFRNGGALLRGVAINTVFTVEFFARMSSFKANMAVLCCQGQSYFIIRFKNSLLSLYITDQSGLVTELVFTYDFNLDTDYHIAITYDPFNTKDGILYVDGIRVASLSASVIQNHGNSLLFIGGEINSSGAEESAVRFDGVLGELAIYNYALPPERILDHYDAISA